MQHRELTGPELALQDYIARRTSVAFGSMLGQALVLLYGIDRGREVQDAVARQMCEGIFHSGETVTYEKLRALLTRFAQWWLRESERI